MYFSYPVIPRAKSPDTFSFNLVTYSINSSPKKVILARDDGQTSSS
jgi:hypothetical protein